VDVRDRLADIGLGAGLAAVLAFWAFRIAGSWGGAYWWFDCAAGAVVCVIALLRRRRKAWAAAAGLAVAMAAILVARFAGLPSEPGPAMALALAVLLGSAVRTLPVRSACAVAAGGGAVAAACGLMAHSSGVPVVAVLLAGCVVGVCPRLLAVRRHAMVDRVRRDERLELARELHDVVAHHITAIVLQAQTARLRQPVDGPLAGIEAAGSDALAAMRRLVALLRDTDDAVPATPGPERLGDLVNRFNGPAVKLRLPEEDESAWPPEVASTVYRIVQESLTNVSRHARHARTVTVDVTVDVTSDGDAVIVEVADDAPPVPARRGGYGLVGMRERVEAIGGTLHAGPRTGGGWTVRAALPLPARTSR
jgi:signal transduction histidine kinase